MELIARICKHCKKEFNVKRIDIERGKIGNYCSQKCGRQSNKVRFRINHKKDFGVENEK